jgi:S-adenosylmethionine-diacylglycerol 3-amino-3-carboxypropyl transferase
MYTPPFRSSISYSVQNEDYRSELAVLDRLERDDLRVLMVASSGENVLSVLTQYSVASVDAVDLNPAQIRLCELRQAAIIRLSRDEQLRLLASDGSSPEDGRNARLALYERVRPHLPDDARAFWDERRDHDLAFGVHYVGRNDVSNHDLQDALSMAGFAPLERLPHEEDLPAWKSAYTNLFTPTYIRDLFGLPSDALAMKIAGIASYLGECHFNAVRRPDANLNPFVTTVFANRYATDAGEAGLPLYLQKQGQEALQRQGTDRRLRLHIGNLLHAIPTIAEADGVFDLISISNIGDWLNDEQMNDLVLSARANLQEGGALLVRTATGRTTLVDAMRPHLHVDDAFNTELAQIERGPWFRVTAAGFKRA